ncbi:Light-harvest protein [Gracilaria domingensis]|nr:Light-harvest protein [Gracilaria domingensis]
MRFSRQILIEPSPPSRLAFRATPTTPSAHARRTPPLSIRRKPPPSPSPSPRHPRAAFHIPPPSSSSSSSPVVMIAFVSGFAGVPLTRASAFTSSAFAARHAPVRTARFSMSASKSVPFLPQPEKLDGTLAGDVGFDPLGFSDMFDINFLREAEVKHGRICMLAIVGWVFPEAVYHLPNEIYSATNPLEAVGKVGWLPIIQILLFIAVCEAATSYKKVYEEKCADPGNYGFDPLNLAGSPEKKLRQQTAEIKNGRLAMCAIGGAIHHTLLTNMGLVEQIQAGKWCKLS